MKRYLNVKISLVAISVVVVSLFVVTIVNAASKNYHGLTTISYNNSIIDSAGWGWNGGFSDRTTPSYSMDQFGYNYWQTYNSCNGSLVYSTIYSLQQWYLNNVSICGNGIARTKYQCPAGQTLRGHDYVQHWWQDGGYAGDGGTLDTSMVLTNP